MLRYIYYLFCFDHIMIFFVCLIALCLFPLSGFFYTLFSRHKTGAVGKQGVSLSLPEGLDVGSVALLLDFMYTSRLPLSPGTASGVLAAATYLQMEHVAETCRAFLQKRWVQKRCRVFQLFRTVYHCFVKLYLILVRLGKNALECTSPLCVITPW